MKKEKGLKCDNRKIKSVEKALMGGEVGLVRKRDSIHRETPGKRGSRGVKQKGKELTRPFDLEEER